MPATPLRGFLIDLPLLSEHGFAAARMNTKKILLFANTDWYLFNFRRGLAGALQNAGWQVVLVSPPGVYGPRLREDGFRWIPFPFSTRSINPLKELGVVIRLAALYRREKPALVHHFTIKCVLYGSLAARFTGVKRVVNAVTGMGHIFTDQGVKARLLRPLVRRLYRFVLLREGSRVIFQNEEDMAAFQEAGMAGESSSRLIRGSGVDCSLFRPVEQQNSGKVPKVLFASRLLREKGVYELIEAIRRLRARGYQAEFLLAGGLYPGNPSSLTEEELREVRREGLVEYLGHVEDMPACIAECDLAVLPSYREGTPRILIEAAAMGKPVVATDIAGCRGLVEDGVNGFLVPVKSPGDLAGAIQKLLDDKALREKMGRAGRKIVLEGFDQDIVINKTFEVYRELFGNKTEGEDMTRKWHTDGQVNR